MGAFVYILRNAPKQGAGFKARPDGLAPQHEESGFYRELPFPQDEMRAERASKQAFRQGGPG
jgi:hypothetical protein